ncbi:eukaryotic integral membrane protein-domain-containing protein [Fimicolochytrium jonesii]|uniref:eukaryotic integral membrane protein-domain-containing protein n=1 Tax=Fimicolochytrium jonesii TaxID=1396493 RepID=UPI0022FF0AAA|nr:eukaryotic integral membrane protein-domain-containing protein [Fimicolochytrium jonesii]KAI8823116.1 eukaryotic integral membrane protein-domain-containing protein [Fimicolochytrium jonesii]
MASIKNFNPRSIPIATRSLLGAAIVLSLAGLVVPHEYLALRPATSFYYIWTFALAGLWEINIFSLAINSVGLVLSGKYFESHWGTKEFAKYVAIVNLSTYFGVLLATVFEYAVTMDYFWLFGSEASGLAGLLAGFLVSFKQAVPEHSIKVFNVISIRAKYIPSLYLLANFILFALRIIHVHFFIIFFGTLGSWVYTRFYKKQDGIKGDRSETFSFASFFPDFLHPFIKPLSNTVYKFAVAAKLCPPLRQPLPTTTPVAAAGSQQAASNPPAASDADAERRRALALKALDSRLASTPDAPGAR